MLLQEEIDRTRKEIRAVNIVEKESDEMIKYELFQRLNTGGAIATPQEVKNCILIMLNKQLYELSRVSR